MIKSNIFRAALLVTSALVSASVARAQSVPTDTWNIGSVTNSATNDGTVTLNGSITDTPTITAGTGNAIAGAAIGASATQSIVVNVTGDAPLGNVTYGAIDLDAVNTSSGDITVSGDLGTSGTIGDAATIVAGTDNAISLAAVGASAGLSYSGVQDASSSEETYTFASTVDVDASNAGAVTVGAAAVGGESPTPADPAGIYTGTISNGTGNSISVAGVGSSASLSLASNVSGSSTAATIVSLEGAVDIGSVNSGAVSVTSEIGSSAITDDGAIISNGTSNSISTAAVGASASASYSGVQTGTAGNETFAIAYDLGDDGLIGGLSADDPDTLTITATNNVGGTVSNTSSIYDATISTGTANGVSVAAVGSSASFAATSLVSGATTAPTTTLVAGNITVSSTNRDTEGSADPAVTLTGNVNDATIEDGASNTISAAAVGASASVGYSGVQTEGSNGDETFLLATDGIGGMGTIGITGLNDGDVTSTSTINTAFIDGGYSNGISVAAVGSSAAFSVDTIVSGADTTPTTEVKTGNINVDSTNNGNVTVTGAIDVATIDSDATSSSVASTAVGASGSVSVSQITTVSATPDETFVLGTIDMGVSTSSPGVLNTGSVTVASGGIDDADIIGGTSNSITQAAVGASGSISLSSFVDTAAPTGEVTIGISQMGVKNTGIISITADIGTPNTGGDIATIGGGTNNSISVAGVGASGSMSFTTIGNNSGSMQTYTVGNAAIAVLNTGSVTVSSNSYGATISGGTGNSVSSAAVGASATTSFTVIVK